MSRDITKQKADALQTEVYTGPTIRNLNGSPVTTKDGKPVTFDQLSKALQKAINHKVDKTLFGDKGE